MKVIGFLTLLACVFAVAADTATPAPADAAKAFLASLKPDQRKLAVGAFNDDEREDWHYVPRRRTGLSLKTLTAKQKSALRALLASVLTDEGQRKAWGVIMLEGVLVELGGDPDFRDPDKYHTRIYGEPGGKTPWGLRIEGHHLSLHYTSGNGAVVSSTPAFFGANPHRVPRGRHKDVRVLFQEEDVARGLLMALDAPRRKRARWSERAPREIVSGAQSKLRLETFVGIPANDLDKTQRKKLRELIDIYAQNHRDGAAFVARMNKAGFDKVHFAWSGSTEPRKPHYYRVHGPTFVIEYCNSQSGGNHSHTVLREFDRDFGRDWLAEHFKDHN